MFVFQLCVKFFNLKIKKYTRWFCRNTLAIEAASEEYRKLLNYSCMIATRLRLGMWHIIIIMLLNETIINVQIR